MQCIHPDVWDDVDKLVFSHEFHLQYMYIFEPKFYNNEIDFHNEEERTFCREENTSGAENRES